MATFGKVEEISKDSCDDLQLLVHDGKVTAMTPSGNDLKLFHSNVAGSWTGGEVLSNIGYDPYFVMHATDPTVCARTPQGLQYSTLDSVTQNWSEPGPEDNASPPRFPVIKVLPRVRGHEQLIGFKGGNLIVAGMDKNGASEEKVIAKGLPEHGIVVDGAIDSSGNRAVTLSDGKRVWGSVPRAAGDYTVPMQLADYTGQTAGVEFVRTAATLDGKFIHCWTASETDDAGQTIILGRADANPDGSLIEEPAVQTIQDVQPGSFKLYADERGCAQGFWIGVRKGYPMGIRSPVAGKWDPPEMVAPIAVTQCAPAVNLNGDRALGLVEKEAGAVYVATSSETEEGWRIEPTELLVDPSGSITTGIDDDGNIAVAAADIKGIRVVRGTLA